jgi:hypothetical protein
MRNGNWLLRLCRGRDSWIAKNHILTRPVRAVFVILAPNRSPLWPSIAAVQAILAASGTPRSVEFAS